ncbi:putative Ribosomal RNA small subunit methyltransferase B (rRNA (cytosine-C(5)-)-methyltransferase) (16S rRNA m5C967 methyltransferase)(rsmB) [Bradyrhizobium sp. ORS 285]|uniref:RsmB/NOP family class I SAM-dependent RNA methyltransferase n=1 Tax=Bradyrhizobium sp. ORS 285 TaxID=115808 RepID=UPI0002409A72|nr:transcription antitermination factor NusB [Bradyrhizobium sp. ORS 285]CCD86948.1 putative Ribosomal RNA small subunit methyltransferase B (rRNA (cytosine-C(5)-)-methyltransferase) (16S rRNA m5C967 methyltransferase)(rsmB) [Bradyrhizobium sp. ORS 285]SMX61918.1 putative Ribosomal RNA small subunit methyltransferase B (rRNA (cytosine-C(5)-)-methyltransferase) (16S rRNA m5C967 methyltransferase)(rsmB) [Bradyrhizobium sp. ORS 285]
MPPPRFATPSEVPGLAARRIAADVIDGVLHKHRTLDDQLDGSGAHPGLKHLADRDRALMRRLVATTLRRLGTLGNVLSRLLDRGIPTDAPRAQSALLIGAAQILWMDVPDHAAVDLSVRLVQADRRAAKYAGLVNAVLRRCAREGTALLDDAQGQPLDIAPWLLKRWIDHYGEATAKDIAAALGQEPSLDLTVKSDPAQWASRLHGEVLPTSTVRTLLHGSVTVLPGFSEGQWWVQDAAAALPARLLGDVSGKTVADLCAAPGGKTAQLAHGGARVTAVDRSPARMNRLKENMTRLQLTAETVVADAAEWQPVEAGGFDALLLDAPCTSTGTIRRHPDVGWLRSEADITALSGLQARLLTRAASLLKPGGTLVYCTCSLEPEEGEQLVDGVLAAGSELRRVPITPSEVAGLGELVTPAGDLRTLPCHLPHQDPRLGGLDGFYAARLERRP